MSGRFVADVLDIMRLGLGRRNENDQDSSDVIFLRYLNDFVSLSMSDDVKLFEQFDTLVFTIDENTTTSGDSINGAITFDDACAQGGKLFQNISQECYISLLDPINNSVSWNFLPIYQNPGEFYAIWGINNDEILIPGYPTNLLYYGNEFVFRTIPNTSYLVKIFGYKRNDDYATPDVQIQFDTWLRYLAYGAMVNYAQDFRYDPESKLLIEKGFARERKLMLTRTHNQIKMARPMPRF